MFDRRIPGRRTKAEALLGKPIHWETADCWDPCKVKAELSSLCIYEIPEISIVLEGNGFHCILNQAIPCKAGDVFITRPAVPHGFFTAEAGGTLRIRRLWFDPADWFSGESADPAHPHYCYGVFSDSALVACATLTARIKEDILSGLDSAITETQKKKNHWRKAVSAHLMLLLIAVERYIGDAIKSTTAVQTRKWGVVSEVIRKVNEDFADPGLTLQSISQSLCLSQSHLSRMFRQLTGESFSEYLRNIRLEQACRLLRETDLSVEQIIYRCGMRDVPSFYRVFRRYTLKTPSRYREEIGERHQGGITMIIMSEISTQVQNGKWRLVQEQVQKALDEGVPVQQILKDGLLAGMQVIGDLFKNNEVYIPEVLVAARAMNAGVQVLEPYLIGDRMKAVGKVCIGTVQGDLHDIGKNLVKMMMEGKGLEVIDLGTDVPAEVFVKTAIEQECKVICCSALLTTTMSAMEDVVKAAETAGIRDKVKIMIGGAPVTEEYCRKIGADVYAQDAASAADAAVELCR